MKIASYTLFVISIIISILHLLFCFFEKEKPRKISKVFCVATLAISICLYAPNSYWIYLGAAFGAIGDYFLIYKNEPKKLLLGIISFFIGHCFYASQIFIWAAVPKYAILIYAILEITLMLTLYLSLINNKEKEFKEAAGPGIFYFTLLGSMFVLSLLGSILTKDLVPSILLTLGYATFIASDITLSYTGFVKNKKRADFYIMLTYLAAQYLITIGLVFTNLYI